MSTVLDYTAWTVVILSAGFVLYCFAAALIEAIKENNKDGMKLLVVFLIGAAVVVWALFRVTGGI